ncbi:MAG: GAF domain-containing protein [Candidatus Rokubacteria bacterium]|nr:GAF domain-containing protein [Candidatus Rokubacteria bacterium]
MQLSLNAIPLFVVAWLNLAIGLYIFRRNPNSQPNRAFALMASTDALWTVAVALSHYSIPPAVQFVRVALAAGSLMALGILALAESFPATSGPMRSLPMRVFAPVAVAFSLASLSPLLVVSATQLPSGLRVTYGHFYPVFAIYVLTCFAFALRQLLSKYRASSGLLRVQTGHLFFALFIPITLGTATSLLLPLVLQVSALGRFGPFFSLLMIAMIAHAIIRHRLMDIRVVIKRGAVYLAAFIAAGLILGALLVGSNLLLHDEPQVPLREILIALVVAVLFHPIKGQIRRVFDRYLYREPYDYQRTVRQASRALTGTIDLPTLLGHVSGIVGRTLRPEGLAIYLLDEEEGLFERAFGSGGAPGPATLPVASPLPGALSRDRKLVFRDELGQEGGAWDAPAVRAELSRLGAEVIVPLLEEDRLIGLLAVGPKRSGDPYFSDDADLLTTLANQSAVAVRNAQTHQQVVQVNEDIAKILGTIESGVIAVGPKGRVTLFNRAAELLTTAAGGALRGQPVDHLPAPLAHLLAATAGDGQSRSQMEIALPDAAGQLLPIMCSTSPLVGPQGVTLGAAAVFSDLSRLKELEQEKRRAERLASLEAIASGMVHEVRNPLVSLKAFIQLLPARHQEPEFRERFMGIMEREINRIDDLLGRFRTLASSAAQPMEPVDVSVPMRATLELLEPQIQARQIRLRHVADGTPRPVLGNASELQQLFHNLCLNAMESMNGGGELTVRVADLTEARGNTLIVEVSDTGPGIPDDLLPRIFNPFVTTKARGSGLGLAICRGIADAHRATLRARNNTERPGSTFTVEFPAISDRVVRVSA